MDEELLNDIRRTGSHFAKLSRFQRGHTPVKGEQAFRFYLSRHKKVQSGDFAKLLGFGTGRVANIAKSLEKKGRIIREKDQDDGRITYFSLTDKGRKRVTQVKEKTMLFLETRVNRWGEEKRKTYLERTDERIGVFEERRIQNVQTKEKPNQA